MITSAPRIIHFFLLVLLAYSCTFAQQPTDRITVLNKVRKPSDAPFTMSASSHDGYTLLDNIFVVASEKGTSPNGKPCFWVKHPRATSWTALEAEIQDFIYEEGIEYQIACQIKTYTDSSKVNEYTLTGVDSKKKKKSDLRKEQEKPLFEDTTWKITHFEEGQVKKGYMTIVKGEIGMSLGCNGLGGVKVSANEKNNSVKFVIGHHSAMTCMACEDRVAMQQESKLFEILAEINSYESKEGELLLKKDNKVLMRMKR